MKLPEVKNADKYTGLYIVDFGDHCGVGFTAAEVAELLESEQFTDISVYKVYNAQPDGTMELKGIRREEFQLEKGMFFYAVEEQNAIEDFERILSWATGTPAPSRVKVHLAHCPDGQYVTALIYPAEFDDEFSQWLLDGQFSTRGPVEGGAGAVEQYYEQNIEVLRREQLFPTPSNEALTGQELLNATRRAIVR
ncbi:MAG: hypothetical protein JXA82_12880 [Sedimentisphaerales bacterium]|nr:hypothetical protein [Sedimentisphaerales bacterium]